jgi:ATP-dependent DNA helicase RecG
MKPRLEHKVTKQVNEDKQYMLMLEDIPEGKSLATLTVEDIYNRLPDPILLAQLGEDRRVERKSARITARALGDYFSMWANTPDGGVLVIGIEKDGEITGCVQLDQNQINEIEDAARVFCCEARFESKRVPCVRTSDGKSDFLIIFRVHYHKDKVVKTSAGQAFIRSSDKAKEIRDEELRELQIAKGEVHYEYEPVTLIFPDDFNSELIAEFVSNYAERNGLELPHKETEILVHRRLGVINPKGVFIPNNACCLLFAKDPMRIFPGCKLRFMRFEGETEKTGEDYNLVKDVMLEGPIPTLIQEAEKLISSHLREYTALDSEGRFYTAPEYPKIAWYEAIVNACAHRSYSLKTMNIFVKMFDDKLVVTSPGSLPPLVTPENIFEIHHPRNPIVMEGLRYFGLVKCANEGTRRMRDAMIQSKLSSPTFKQTKDSGGNVAVTLQNNYKQRRRFVDSDATKKIVSETIFKTLSEEDRRLINSAAENQGINVTQAMRLLDCDWGTAKRRLQSLANRQLLLREVRKDITRDAKAKYVLRGSN